MGGCISGFVKGWEQAWQDEAQRKHAGLAKVEMPMVRFDPNLKGSGIPGPDGGGSHYVRVDADCVTCSGSGSWTVCAAQPLRRGARDVRLLLKVTAVPGDGAACVGAVPPSAELGTWLGKQQLSVCMTDGALVFTNGKQRYGDRRFRKGDVVELALLAGTLTLLLRVNGAEACRWKAPSMFSGGVDLEGWHLAVGGNNGSASFEIVDEASVGS
jgi:hypothetical protein